MKAIFSGLIILLFSISSNAKNGCLVRNFDPLNKVFNNPVSVGSTEYKSGNGNNFVLWENGDCGPYIYISISGPSLGTCTLEGLSQTGHIYAISDPFPYACPVPLDDYLWILLLFAGGIAGYVISSRKLIYA